VEARRSSLGYLALWVEVLWSASDGGAEDGFIKLQVGYTAVDVPNSISFKEAHCSVYQG